MKTIEIANAKQSLSDYANQVENEALVVVRNGKPVALLSSVHGMDAESIALANNPKFAAIIKRSRARHQADGGISSAEVRKRLGLEPRRRATAGKRTRSRKKG
jgi:PHD/YefM family antitoxin component YafN of YafNO toxin-antitoxin module